jgi:hypothetical protein
MRRNHEIHSAYLIRALARGDSPSCEQCGGRMFVKPTSGLCPFCAAGRPPRAAVPHAAVPADVPFLPRLATRPVRHPRPLRRILREWFAPADAIPERRRVVRLPSELAAGRVGRIHLTRAPHLAG